MLINKNASRRIAIAALLAMATSTSAAMTTHPNVAAVDGQANASGTNAASDKVMELYGAILQSIAMVPTGGDRQQYQAQITYVVYQSNATCPQAAAALQEVLDQPRHDRRVIGALRDVMDEVARCGPGGTAALGGLSRQALQTLQLGPAIGLGGGGSNYGNP